MKASGTQELRPGGGRMQDLRRTSSDGGYEATAQ
jgi:hypothetical protein